MSQNNQPDGVPAEKSPWKRLDFWGVMGALIAAGAIAGSSVTQYLVRADANEQIKEIRSAYDEAGKTRLTALNLCLRQATAAANNAANAAKEAATKANAAQQAADKAAAAVTGEVPPQ